MKKHNLLPQLLSSYFLRYIPERSGYSENTIKSYRDTFILLFRYQEEVVKRPVTKLSFETLSKDYIFSFLKWLENDNGYSSSSVNQRLAAIHAFCKFVISEAPEYMEPCTSILSIKMRRLSIKPMDYLSIEAIKVLLSLPDTKCKAGRRDLAILTLLYDSGSRVQELADLTVGSVRKHKPATVKLIGKGNKTRIIPIMPQTLEIISTYMEDVFLTQEDIFQPLFFNKQKRKLTRVGISYILNKYIGKARTKYPEMFPKTVTPHTLRHSKAMHLLEGGVNLIYIRDFLGHTSVITTEIYAKSNPEIKRKAIEDASPKVLPVERYTFEQKKDMINWLKTII